MSDGLLYALGHADANMYICSEDLRPSKSLFLLVYMILLLFTFLCHCRRYFGTYSKCLNFCLHCIDILRVFIHLSKKMQKTSPKDSKTKDVEKRPQSSKRRQNDGQKMAEVVLNNKNANACTVHSYISTQSQSNVFQQCTNLHLTNEQMNKPCFIRRSLLYKICYKLK